MSRRGSNSAGYALENGVAQLLAVYQAQGKLQFQQNFNGGRFDPKRGVFLTPSGPGRVDGVPDFTCSVAPHGRTVHLECKAGTARQTDAQKEFQRVSVLMGARYLVIRSVDDVARVLTPANDNRP
ncbi:hypothetical protein [Methylobacterium sp. Gmos1]